MLCKYITDIYSNYIQPNLMADEISFNYYVVEDFRFVWSNVKTIKVDTNQSVDIKYWYFEDLYFKLSIYKNNGSTVLQLDDLTFNILMYKYKILSEFNLSNFIELITGHICMTFTFKSIRNKKKELIS